MVGSACFFNFIGDIFDGFDKCHHLEKGATLLIGIAHVI